MGMVPSQIAHEDHEYEVKDLDDAHAFLLSRCIVNESTSRYLTVKDRKLQEEITHSTVKAMSKHIRRARLAGKVLAYVPFLRLAALNGSVVRGEENPKSDVDILIIARAGRLYTCRAFAILLIHLTGWRRHGKKLAGRICLNCYLNDKNPDILPERKNSQKKVAKAYKYMIALVDEKKFNKFYKINKWFDQIPVAGKEHCQLLRELAFRNFPLKSRSKLLEKILSGKIGDRIEEKLMRFQLRRILNGKRRGDEIYADDKAIKLHPHKMY